MEIIQEKQIENLIKDGVIIATQEYLLKDDDTRQKVGNVFREAYGNWKNDRDRLCKQEPKEIVNAVMAIWGDAPTINLTTTEKSDSLST